MPSLTTYKLLKQEHNARRGEFKTVHGTVQTPAFQNVATAGAIKGGLSAHDLKDIGAQVMLCNTYHLHLRPGDKLVAEMGGLHKFTRWNGPILTDSGGFQVFSLAKLRKITEEGVTFASHLDGHRIFMGPEESMQIQANLGSTIAMAFDECVENPAQHDYSKASCERTTRWLKRCKDEMARLKHEGISVNPDQLLFGINQGGTFEDIRIAHCWAHARRDFADAVKLLKKGGPSKQRIKKTIAYQALERIGTMYALEDEWKGLTLSERLSRRQEHMKPLVEAYFAWVKGIDLDTVLSEKTKGGLQYSINQEKYLRTFLEYGEVPIDNSASERSIRPFCVGRSNWHVIDSIKGAQASAIVYSIVETAKANNLKPYEYLQHLLSVMMVHMYDADTAYLDDLMPWSENLPDVCKKTP